MQDSDLEFSPNQAQQIFIAKNSFIESIEPNFKFLENHEPININEKLHLLQYENSEKYYSCKLYFKKKRDNMAKTKQHLIQIRYTKEPRLYFIFEQYGFLNQEGHSVSLFRCIDKAQAIENYKEKIAIKHFQNYRSEQCNSTSMKNSLEDSFSFIKSFSECISYEEAARIMSQSSINEQFIQNIDKVPIEPLREGYCILLEIAEELERIEKLKKDLKFGKIQENQCIKQIGSQHLVVQKLVRLTDLLYQRLPVALNFLNFNSMVIDSISKVTFFSGLIRAITSYVSFKSKLNSENLNPKFYLKNIEKGSSMFFQFQTMTEVLSKNCFELRELRKFTSAGEEYLNEDSQQGNAQMMVEHANAMFSENTLMFMKISRLSLYSIANEEDFSQYYPNMGQGYSFRDYFAPFYEEDPDSQMIDILAASIDFGDHIAYNKEKENNYRNLNDKYSCIQSIGKIQPKDLFHIANSAAYFTSHNKADSNEIQPDFNYNDFFIWDKSRIKPQFYLSIRQSTKY